MAVNFHLNKELTVVFNDAGCTVPALKMFVDSYIEDYVKYADDPDEDFYDIIEKAKKYAHSFGKLIKEGKSTIFAHHYADQFASSDGYYQLSELYCEKFAYAMEKAITQGLTEGAYRIANEYGEVICSGYIYSRYYNKYFGYLLGNPGLLSKLPITTTKKITRKELDDCFELLTEEELAEFVLDAVIAHEKK
jgi:hypothetical protein